MPKDRMTVLKNPEGQNIYLIGAKGTGMCALAEYLADSGARIAGSDVEEVFYTDAILARLGMELTSFGRAAIPEETELVIRSAAYGESHPLVASARERGLPVLTYPEALGELSRLHDSSAIAGVHGKTTTTAMAGALLRALGTPATVVAGSAVADFDGRCTWNGGRRFLVAETCEYRRHFLNYAPRRIVLTSVEHDHQDYYQDYNAVEQAFLDFLLLLPENGELIYCCDDDGARRLAARAAGERSDIRVTPYGEGAQGNWGVRFEKPAAGKNGFRVAAFPRTFSLPVPGKHMALNAAAALALADSLERELSGGADGMPAVNPDTAAKALANFRGCMRRSEIIGEKGGILFMDDYAHHPTAISATLGALRDFYPDRRLVVDFIPHTYSRTAALLDAFAASLREADYLILHPIYASARESYSGGVSGRDLWEKTMLLQPNRPGAYHNTLDEAFRTLMRVLRRGDLFLTMGAGNNSGLGKRILEEYNP